MEISGLFTLLGALLAPMAGALLYAWLHNRLGIVRLVDGFVYVAIPVLVIFHTWTNQGNVWAFVALFLGVIIPFIIERLSQKLAPHTDNMALLAGISGLFLHAFLEGAALSIPKEVYFTYAVLLHRIPVGIMIWWLLHPRHGSTMASLGIAGIVIATLIGFIAGMQVFVEDSSNLDLYQAFVGGTLLHVVFHQGRHDHASCRT